METPPLSLRSFWSSCSQVSNEARWDQSKYNEREIQCSLRGTCTGAYHFLAAFFKPNLLPPVGSLVLLCRPTGAERQQSLQHEELACMLVLATVYKSGTKRMQCLAPSPSALTFLRSQGSLARMSKIISSRSLATFSSQHFGTDQAKSRPQVGYK